MILDVGVPNATPSVQDSEYDLRYFFRFLQVLWFGDRYIGVQLYNPWSYADIARSMKAEGITCTHRDQIADALQQAVRNQEEGKTTVVELMFTRELGDPFRRDAMKLPIRHLDKYKRTIQTTESSTGQPVDM